MTEDHPTAVPFLPPRKTLATLRRVVVPIMAPAILVATVLGLIRSLDAFEIELLLGTPVRLFVYSTKIREQIGWEPQVELRNGIERTIEWYASRPEVRPAPAAAR